MNLQKEGKNEEQQPTACSSADVYVSVRVTHVAVRVRRLKQPLSDLLRGYR